MIKRTFILPFCLLLFTSLEAGGQQNEAARDTAWLNNHSTQRATLYSAVLPGLGQAYNRQYWKVPIVYAGFAVIVYFIIDNTRNYYGYRDGYYNLRNETGDDSYKELNLYKRYADLPGYDREVMLDIFSRARDYYRRYREVSILSFAGFYLLNIIEANISAHFLHFDIGEDLTVDVIPSMNHASILGNKNAGLTLSFRF